MTNLGGLIHKVAHKMKREIDHANQKLGDFWCSRKNNWLC